MPRVPPMRSNSSWRGLVCPACYDFVATSGEAGIEALNAFNKPVGFVGTAGDREILEGRGVRSPRARILPTSPAPE